MQPESRVLRDLERELDHTVVFLEREARVAFLEPCRALTRCREEPLPTDTCLFDALDEPTDDENRQEQSY